MTEVQSQVVKTKGDHDPRFQSLYHTLRSMARARLRRHETFTLLDTTVLLHESFLRLARAGGVHNIDEPAFLAYASKVMRSVIVDAARSSLAQRRGAGAEVVPLDEESANGMADSPDDEILLVHEALLALESTDPRLSQVISLRYFSGMTEPEIAACMDLGERTVRRDIERAQSLLRALLS